MITQHGKRVLSFLLAVIMVFSAVPVQVFADELQDGQDEGVVVTSELVELVDEVPEEIPEEVVEEIPEEPVEEVPEEIIEELVVTENVAAEQVVEPEENIEDESVRDEVVSEVQTRIDEILNMYLGTTSVENPEDLQNLVAEMDEIDRMDLQFEILVLEEDLEYMELTTGEKKVLIANNAFMIALCEVLMEYPVDYALYTTIKMMDGNLSLVDTQNTIKNNNGTITATAKGSLFNKKTNTITITNNLTTKAKLSFNYNVDKASSYNVAGVTNKTSGLYSDVIEPGKSITITITSNSGISNLTVTLTLTNISLVAAKDSSEVTFQYDNNLGSVTVGGVAVESGTTQDIAVSGVELKATPKSGCTFVGWIDQNHKIVSQSATYTLEPAENMTVQAVFGAASNEAWFLVNGNSLYQGLNEALTAVSNISNKTIVLADNGTLPAGDYTIPSGVTLLIPYNDANTLCTTAPVTQEGGSTPSAYRTMTMAEGAKIIINGALSLSAVQNASGGSSSPVGACSFIQMESGSSITVNNGGNLYAWGFIQGSGSVTVENGGSVYECFQVKDWRGGENTSGMVGNSYRVFPMSQYYIQNIEVPMTLKAGAIENGYMSVAISLVGIQGSQVPFIGSNGMFQITSGHIVKDYDENTGRLLIDVYGNLSVKSLSISMKISVIGTKTINSKDYVLPINGNMTINMHSGSVTMTQDIALQPGSKLIVGKDATCTLGSGNKIFVYDYDQWTTEVAEGAVGEGPSFCGTGDATHVNLTYPASAKNVQGRDQDAYVEVNGIADLAAGYVYTTESGANIRGTGTIIMKPGKADEKTYQVKHTGSENKNEKWVSIPITSAKLTNADGSVVETAGIAGKVIYKSVNGVWTCEHTYAEGTYKEELTAATCTADGQKKLSCNCGEVSKTETIKALGHEIVQHNAQAPTCTEVGWNAYEACFRCDYTTKVEIEAKGHTEVVDAAKAPTCTETGLTEGKHCSVCNTVIVAQETVKALGHTAGAEANCTTAQTCTVCGAELVKALGHKEVTDAAKAPTCTETGLTEGKHCSVCGETTVAQKPVDALGHTPGAEATCTTAQTCTVCDTELVKALGHKEVTDAAKAPTCTETGLTEGKHCSVCNTVTVAQETVKALGHTAGAEATCTTAQNCTVCGAELVKALGHTEVIDKAVDPTCTETGLTEGKHCSVCNEVILAQETVNALGHKEVTDAAKAPTCTETGLTAGKHCSVCNAVLVAQKTIDAKGHIPDREEPTENDDVVCTVCGTVLEVALGHQHALHLKFVPAVAADCENPGNIAHYICETDNKIFKNGDATEELEAKDIVIAPTGHTAGAEATCTTAQTCTVCGAELVKALGHKEVTDKAVAPTCTETGLTEGKHCSVCNEVTVAQETVDALGHSYKDVVTEPTCTEAGYTTYTCACGDTYTGDEVAALGHNHQATVTYPAGVVKGYTVYTCSQCGDFYRTEWLDADAYAGKTIAAIGDSITAGVGVTKDQNDYVKLLADQLGMSYIRLGVSGTTLATDGSRTCNIGQLTAEKLNGADVVTIAMGINDFAAAAEGYYELGNIDSTDTSTIYGAMKMWCERIEELKNTDSLRDTQFYFVTPVITSWNNSVTAQRDWDQSKTNIHGYTLRDLCNAIIEVAACYNVAVIDLNLLSGMYYVDAQDNNVAEFGGDGVHPGAGGHAMMADALAKALLQSDLRDDHDHVYGSFITTTWAYCSDGMKHQVCSACGHVSEGVVIPTVGHIEVQHEAKAPTCTEIGWDAYETCSRCDYTTKVELPVDPENHDVVKHEEKVPTCTETGWDAYETCSRCAYTTRGEDLPIDPEGHVWDEGEPYKNHSCNSASYIRYKCTLCEETKLVVDREQHFRVPIAEKIPATCTESGMTSGWKCEKCDEFWIPQEVIPALGHDWNGNFPCQSETSACTREGCDLHFDSKQECKRVEVAGYPATCTEPGLTDGAYCEYCGEDIVAQTEIPVADHAWITAQQEVPATCNTVGHHAGARYCMDCDYDENAIPMLEHEWMHREAKKATYSAIGWNAHDYCLLCNVTRTLEQYEGAPCEFCGENPEEYTEIPKVEVQKIPTVDEFLTNIGYLELMAEQYAKEHPGTDPLALVLNYMRTAVANYTSGSWAIMAGPEDKDFLKFVQTYEDSINSNPEIDVWVNVSGLKKLGTFTVPSNETNHYYNRKVVMLSGHFFGTMDMTYHNKGSQNHADVGGWVGDLTDLLSTTDEYGVPAGATLEEKIAYITQKYLFKEDVAGAAGSFGSHDLYADLDAYYFCNELITKGYNTGDLEKMMREYYQPGLTLKKRVAYLLTNRLDGLSTRQDLRTAVYNAYTSNKLISTLEGTRNFNASGNELAELRKAVCYAFADEMCRHAGDYVEDLTNERFTIFDTETKILAPGISQQINYATNADGKQIVYYVATADVTRKDVGMWVNYYDRDPGTPENPVWKNNSVPSSAQNAQDRYGDPASPDYIPNFNVIASTNAGGYDMSDTATPGGLVVMNGVEWYPQTNTAGFFAILDDGTAYMGTHDQYKDMMEAGKIKEAIGGFGEFVVKDGKVVGNTAYSDAPRTSVGITATGRVVVMCIDGRQAPFSSGASLQDVGYIMKEAGCVIAINLDGGGSTTFVARQPGSDELTVMNRPSDGYPRNVSTNLLIYSTAPSSTKFDHAVIESEYDYATINTPVQMTAAGVSPAGNAVDIPEGATWAVSDEAWASITEDGVFTGKRLGEAYVYLMLDGQVIGSKLMTMTNPDQLYFERAKVDAIYGSSVKLPLRARFEGKGIAINPNDVIFTLSAPAAGTMDGFNFQAAESATKSLSITAEINEDIKASINVMLYKQGENSFDFDKATGGDRTLAWHREVSNSKLEDSNIYNVIDPAKDMVTSYTFAMDMTTIPIPERISELTYMLPGGTMEGATAWSFLLSLAQRISDLSWVKATIDFDDRFVVDYSNLDIKNEYFEMKALEFDEATNTLSVTMSWIKQSQVIDEATANPLCLINGFKLTPKESVWEDVSKINVVTSGNISYEIYMRASGLYGFAQKPESQAVFGIYPYRNPADTSDAGGYFRDTYAEITDEFTLVNVVKEGWVNEEGGFAYYVDGERLTGVKEVEGVYYDFGDIGINVGQTVFTGVFFHEEAKAYRYAYLGTLASGWQSVNGEWYYFSNSTMNAVSGHKKLGEIYYDFEENGKLISGVWAKTLNGVRYYYGPSYHYSEWLEVDGEMYYFEKGYRLTGIHLVKSIGNKAIYKWYDFGEDGIAKELEDGFHEIDGKLYYMKGAISYVGLHKIDGDYYFFTYAGPAVRGQSYYAWETHCDLPCSTYAFGPDGKMVNGLVEMNDGTYYFFNGKIKVDAAGITKIGDDYYFVSTKGKVATGKYYCWATNCELPVGEYEFASDGKMLQGMVEKEDGNYYFVNGKPNGANAGITKVGDAYYFVSSKGKVATGKYYCWATNCELPVGEYEFASDGKMLQGIVTKEDGNYYYVNGKPNGANAGLTKVGDDYYFVSTKGRVATGKYYCWATNCELPVGEYEFGTDGKMLQGIVIKADGTYYYVNGKPNGANAGLTKIGDDYYFVASNGRCATGSYNCWATNCNLPLGTYEFGADGKMLHGLIEKEDGLYSYVYGKLGGNPGLVKLGDDYYFVANNGRVATGSYYCWKTLCDLPAGTYEFGPDGKMYNGFITKADGIYYYVTGKLAKVGLHYIEGYYYFVAKTGRLVTSQEYYVWETNGLLMEKTYTFNELGQIIG